MKTIKNLVCVALVTLTVFVLISCTDGNSLSLDLNETEELRSAKTETENESEPETVELPIVETPAESESEKTMVLVHVCGAVGYSDVYELESGARIVDAIRKAGGFNETAAKDYLNLADVVFDGMKIYVPTEKEVEEGNVPETIVTASNTELVNGGTANVGASQSSQSSGRVNINTATAEQLKTLSGIGDKRANDIVQYRESNGGFKTIEDLKNVSGIGDGIYKNICNDIEV